MNAELSDLFPAVAFFLISVVLTVACLWAGARMTPWFLGKHSEVPTVRSFFLDPMAEQEMSGSRLVTLGLASALLLAILLTLACAVRFGGFTLA